MIDTKTPNAHPLLQDSMKDDWEEICLNVEDRKGIFGNQLWIAYAIIAILFTLYIPSIYFVYRRLECPETRARSPYLTMLLIGLLMCDSVINTGISTLDLGDNWNQFWLCLSGIWTTMLIYVPILLIMYLRVYRLKRVFELYENYLKTMRVTLGD